MRAPLLFLLAASVLPTSAQWSLDPANPLVVCNAANTQSEVRAIPDGSGGWYTFWLDKRADGTNSELYGQHLDEAGQALWTANGKLLQSRTDSTFTNMAPALMPDGTLMIGFIYSSGVGYNGRLAVQHFDDMGNALLPASVELAHSGTGPLGNIFGFGQLKAVVDGNKVFFAWSYVPQGGNDSYAYDRIDLNGDVRFGAPGNGVPNSGWGPFTFRSDLVGGLLFDWRQGNGAGAPLLAMRMDSTGTPAWNANLTVSTGTGGLSYAFNTLDDGAGSVFSAWSSSGDVPMARYDTLGNFEWSPQPFYACDESNSQDNPVLVLNGGYLFVGWGDNRPPAANQDMYVQKFDMTGAPQWTADGVQAIHTNTYIPTPRLVPSDDGVIATFDGTALGFCAQRLLADGSAAWPSPVNFCTPAFNPFYDDQIQYSDGDGGVVAFWATSDGNIHGARIYRYGQLGDHTGITEQAANATLRVYPSPANTSITLDLPSGEHLHSVRAIDAQWRVIGLSPRSSNDRPVLDVSALSNGTYALEVITDKSVRTGRFLVVR